MMNPFGAMYLRPGNLWKSFRVKELLTKMEKGYPVEKYEDTSRTIFGILTEVDNNLSDRMKHRWDQDQHSLTHTVIVRGRADLKKGDLLILEERAFLVLLADDIGSLGTTGLIYLEERNDVK